MLNSLKLFICSLFLMFGTQVFADTNTVKHSMVDWMLNESGFDINPKVAYKIAGSITKHSKTHDVDPFLVLSMIKRESGFRHTIKNRYGAVGLMQVVPRYHKEKIKGRSLTDIDTNIEVGVMILAEYLESNQGSLRKALVKYSGNARNYREKLNKSYEKIKKHDVIYRFQNELPIVQVAQLH